MNVNRNGASIKPIITFVILLAGLGVALTPTASAKSSIFDRWGNRVKTAPGGKPPPFNSRNTSANPGPDLRKSNGGSDAGKTNVQDLHVTKDVNKTSPKLLSPK